MREKLQDNHILLLISEEGTTLNDNNNSHGWLVIISWFIKMVRLPIHDILSQRK